MNVCVTGDVQSIALQSAAGQSPLSASSRASRSISMRLGYHLGQKMASADTAFTWTVSGGIGSVDEKGVFTAGSSMASGTLTCSYGNTRASIPVNVGMGDPQDASFVSTFEDGLGGFTASEGVSLSRVTDYTSVARGTGSLKALWDGESADGFTLSVSPADVADMNYLTLWARSENTHGTLTAVFTDAEGNELTSSPVRRDGERLEAADRPGSRGRQSGLPVAFREKRLRSVSFRAPARPDRAHRASCSHEQRLPCCASEQHSRDRGRRREGHDFGHRDHGKR